MPQERSVAANGGQVRGKGVVRGLPSWNIQETNPDSSHYFDDIISPGSLWTSDAQMVNNEEKSIEVTNA